MTMKVRFAFTLETRIDLWRSAPADTRGKNARVCATFFPSLQKAMRWLYERSRNRSSFPHFWMNDSENLSGKRERIYRTFFMITRGLKISVGFKMSAWCVIILIDLNWSNYAGQFYGAILDKNVRKSNNVIGKRKMNEIMYFIFKLPFNEKVNEGDVKYIHVRLSFRYVRHILVILKREILRI